MKLTRSTEYALMAVGYIARNTHLGPVAGKRIAQLHHIPAGYLLKVLQQLARANILLSVRGPQGGFVLARTAEKISLLEIIEAVEGSFTAPARLQLAHGTGLFQDALAHTYRRAAEQAAGVLAQTTLAGLLAGRRE
jgi:Rrf2 family protein